jgi:pSer/pThr/pTyr-binding forkhead associated (FHA) protein
MQLLKNIEDEVYIRDGQWDDSQSIWCKSKNGTYVNGIKINPNDGLKLFRDDIITIGNTSIKIF